MDHLEKVSLSKLKSSLVLNHDNNFFSSPPKECILPVIFYKRYVDDIFLICNKKDIKKFTDTFNNYNPNIKFTIERENKQNNSINFLGVTVYRNSDSHASTNWYRKTTCSGRYLNFLSHHPIKRKIAIIYKLTDNCILLADKNFIVLIS